MSGRPFTSVLMDDLARESVSLTESLRKARLACFRLKLSDVGRWIDLELKGYEETVDLPTYRQKRGLLQAYNPYHGWQPVLSHDKDFIDKLSSAPIGSSIGVLERQARDPGEFMEFALSAGQRTALSNLLEFQTNVRLAIPPTTPLEILEAVRNLLTDWCFELERSGVTGEGLVFQAEDERMAPKATERFVVNNYGTIGNVVGNAHHSELNAGDLSAVQLESLAELSKSIEISLASLPSELQSKLKSINLELAAEIEKSSPNSALLAELGGSLRKVAESAAGNLTAQGILAALRSIFGS